MHIHTYTLTSTSGASRAQTYHVLMQVWTCICFHSPNASSYSFWASSHPDCTNTSAELLCWCCKFWLRRRMRKSISKHFFLHWRGQGRKKSWKWKFHVFLHACVCIHPHVNLHVCAVCLNLQTVSEKNNVFCRSARFWVVSTDFQTSLQMLNGLNRFTPMWRSENDCSNDNIHTKRARSREVPCVTFRPRLGCTPFCPTEHTCGTYIVLQFFWKINLPQENDLFESLSIKSDSMRFLASMSLP